VEDEAVVAGVVAGVVSCLLSRLVLAHVNLSLSSLCVSLSLITRLVLAHVAWSLVLEAKAGSSLASEP
jgi:hypothetical protein